MTATFHITLPVAAVALFLASAAAPVLAQTTPLKVQSPTTTTAPAIHLDLTQSGTPLTVIEHTTQPYKASPELDFEFAAPPRARAPFTGLGVGLSWQLTQNSLTITPTGKSDHSNTTFEASIDGSYGVSLGSKWVATIDAGFGLQPADYGTYTTTGFASTAHRKNSFSLSVAPGYRVAKNALLYGKIAYRQMDVHYTSTAGLDAVKTHAGTGYGIGYAVALTPDLEARFGYESTVFETQTISALDQSIPKQSSYTFSVFYRF